MIAKVCPTKNNGSAELVTVKETILADKTEPILWFMFQKLKYVWDPEKSQFRGIDFPVHETYTQYVKWKGHQSENDILVAEKTYGKNLMEMVVPEFLELFTERATAPFVSFLIIIWDYMSFALLTQKFPTVCLSNFLSRTVVLG